jgi:hypothetical protein
MNIWEWLSIQKINIQTTIALGGFFVFAVFVLIIIPFVIYPNIKRLLSKKVKWKKGESLEFSDPKNDRRKK